MSIFRAISLGRRTTLGAALAVALATTPVRAESWFDFLAPHDPKINDSPTKDSEKIVKLPAGPQDVYCPGVDILDGGATARAGGEASAEVRYQFNITDVARECDPQGAQFALKIGVAGRLLIGPAGSPGAYSTPLRVEVKRDLDGKVVFTKTYRVAADTSGSPRGAFRIVTEPIMLPLTRAHIDDDYSIAVGFGGVDKVAPRTHRKRMN